jgi:hypothetical protein
VTIPTRADERINVTSQILLGEDAQGQEEQKTESTKDSHGVFSPSAEKGYGHRVSCAVPLILYWFIDSMNH